MPFFLGNLKVYGIKEHVRHVYLIIFLVLAETGLHIAGSNATATVLTLAANGEADTQSANGKTSIEDTLQRLRANPGVLLAEPIPSAATSP